MSGEFDPRDFMDADDIRECENESRRRRASVVRQVAGIGARPDVLVGAAEDVPVDEDYTGDSRAALVACSGRIIDHVQRLIAWLLLWLTERLAAIRAAAGQGDHGAEPAPRPPLLITPQAKPNAPNRA